MVLYYNNFSKSKYYFLKVLIVQTKNSAMNRRPAVKRTVTLGRSYAPSRDRTFLRAERRQDVLAPTRRFNKHCLMYFSSYKVVKSLKKTFLQKEKLIGKYKSGILQYSIFPFSSSPVSFSLSPSLRPPSHSICVKLAVPRTETRAYEYFLSLPLPPSNMCQTLYQERLNIFFKTIAVNQIVLLIKLSRKV